MHSSDGAAGVEARLLSTLQRLLELPAAEVKGTLNQASMLVAGALGADKVDVFLYDAPSASLIARGTSDTPMGRRQHELGLDRMPLANGGRTVLVYRTGDSFAGGRADEDPEMLRGVVEDLGVRSILLVPLDVELFEPGGN